MGYKIRDAPWALKGKYTLLSDFKLRIFLFLSFWRNKFVMIFTERVEKLVDGYGKYMIH